MNHFPKWAAEAVWYQIFPDRFCRSNFSNPISAADIEGTSPWDLSSSRHPWQIHPWTSDWYMRQPYECQNRKSLKTNILRRRYCGDIRGIISKLDYLRDLGVTAIYLNPIQYSPSLHKYDGTDFLHVDPFLGSDPIADKDRIEEEDFDDFDNACWTTADMEALELIREVHARGMRIIFDGVFNHIGYNSKPFQHVLRFRKFSRYSGWFITDFAKSTPKKLVYEKFWGCVDEMPKLNYGCPDVRRYVLAALKRWLKPVVDGVEYQGIDGWRLDHVIGVPPTFWKYACNFTKKLNKDSLFLAELIEPNSIVKPYLDNAIFDSVMNYGFYFSACEFFAQEKNVISAIDFDKKLRSQLSLFPTHCNYLMMNLLGGHDTERLASLIVNRNLKDCTDIASFFSNTHVEDKGYTSRRPNDDERRIQKMMILFEFSMIGSPMVYYGDEVGMWGGNDPDCRKPMVWEGVAMDDERVVCSGRRLTPKKNDPIGIDHDMLDYYKKVIALRRGHRVLCDGLLETDFADPECRIYAYSRVKGRERIVFAYNREDTPAEIEIGCGSGDVFTDYFDGSSYRPDVKNSVKIALEPLGFAVLIKNT